jgi:hypothetical protein
VGLNSLKSLNLTNVYPNNKNMKKKKNNKNNKVKSKPLELYQLAGKNYISTSAAKVGKIFKKPDPKNLFFHQFCHKIIFFFSELRITFVETNALTQTSQTVAKNG